MKIMISFQVDTSDEAQAVIAAVAGIGKEPHACSKQYVDPSTELSDRRVMNGRRAGEVDSGPTLDETPAPVARANVSPGVSTITKIGSNTKEGIMIDLSRGRQPTPQMKVGEHLKLLWARGEVKFDGSEYYL